MPEDTPAANGSAEPAVRVRRVQQTLVITLNRPDRLNAFDLAMSQQVGVALQLAETDPQVRTVILTGSGRAFCAGADIAAVAAGEFAGEAGGNRIFTNLFGKRIAKPVIVAANGLAYGGGMEVLLAADLAICADTATFAIPETKLGILAAGGGLIRLPWVVGPRRAMQMALTGEPIDAGTALEWGLVNQVVPAPEVLDASLAIAGLINANAPLAVQTSRQVIVDSRGLTEAEAWDINDALLPAITESNDAREGARAFLERRVPRWSGS